MRIISQNGNTDINYDYYTLIIDDNCILAKMGDIEFVLGTYSTKEKAEKVFTMLHRAYYEREIEKIYHEGNNQIHPTFQFPKDEDVEV